MSSAFKYLKYLETSSLEESQYRTSISSRERRIFSIERTSMESNEINDT